MKFHEFRGLAPDEKNLEILRLLPLLTPLTEEFASLKTSLSLAIEKVGFLSNIRILTKISSAADDPLVSQSVFTITFNCVSNAKAVVATFNQERALVRTATSPINR